MTIRPAAALDGAVRTAVEALYDAADDDSATGGPDLNRRIWPIVSVVDVEGYRRVDDGTLGDVVQRVVDDRRDDAGGTRAERIVTGEGDAR